MKVTLLNFTGKVEGDANSSCWNAADLLIFTKSTRLNMDPGLFSKVQMMTPHEKLRELEYMAGTIPSSWEFVDYTFLVEGVSRAFTHQQVRTRAASYAQQSMRVTELCDYEYVATEANAKSDEAMRIIEGVNAIIKEAYKELRAIGQAPEDARGILPTNIATNIVCKYNLRTLTELARSRTGGRTQGEYQEVMAAMIARVLEVQPWTSKFFHPKGKDHFAAIEQFAKEKFPDLKERGELLKIVDLMRKGV